MKNWKPWFIEHSKIPVWLSKVAPIEIHAISIGPFVWGRSELSETTRNHETIHFQQQLELLFLFFYLLYGIFWLIGLIKYHSGKGAYYQIPFEQEAYSNEKNLQYLSHRKMYFWRRYKI
tara:strand:- start:70 stop:426 length:357 start_codon:yes stop_codon:yes gene_type:complete